ncbi:hypothetical protein [Pandoraea bronchicola]|uniref:Uncharacterized protein n=1 Tax=Pandoraea bronchicola TaxID=2508287 RepID=A0A5E5BMJ6_9BURK|nr:hypothetical protein [Pandoraea bronchicola]VVE86924.1 hypothetical protein PBR20603_00848 [Pandoraea bronchicola]
MLPTNNAFFAPAANPGQHYLDLAATGRINDTITDVENGLSELLRMQNAALARIDHLIAQSGTQPATRASSADNPPPQHGGGSLSKDMTRCQPCPNAETVTTAL